MTLTFFRDIKDQWRWRVQADNNRIVAISGEGYYNKADCADIAHELFGDNVTYFWPDAE